MSEQMVESVALLDESELPTAAAEAGAAALCANGVTVPNGVSYADVVQHVYDAIYRVISPVGCHACRVWACEVEGNTADPHTCVTRPAQT